MTTQYKLELSVGIFVFIAILCIGYLTIQLGQMHLVGKDYYTLKARFSKVPGLRSGNDVRIAGVTVGRVENISLDKEHFTAQVSLRLPKDIKITDDSIASIKTSGLIGDKYVSISPGGSGIYLQSGDRLIETESPIEIREIISKYVFGQVEKK